MFGTVEFCLKHFEKTVNKMLPKSFRFGRFNMKVEIECKSLSFVMNNILQPLIVLKEEH